MCRIHPVRSLYTRSTKHGILPSIRSRFARMKISFSLSTGGAVTEDLIKTAKDIFCGAWAANNVKVDNSPEKWKQRKYLQERSVAGCNHMLAMIGLAKTLFHLRGKKVQYWSQLVVDTRGLLRKWQEADTKRYGNL